MENPKLVGTNLIDCIPQTGQCPNDCPECFYNRGFYRPLDMPKLPTPREAAGKIVRVNSGHDSNIGRVAVLRATAGYEHKFYNTSIPRFDFPAPVVFTCNGREPQFVHCPPNVMFVRIRCNTWEQPQQEALADFYIGQGVPVVMTFMRYYTRKPPRDHESDYVWRAHILNAYWCPRPKAQMALMRQMAVSTCGPRWLRMCGTPWSSYCADCRNCELLYWECLRRQGQA